MPPVFTDPPVLCGHRGSGRGAGENTLGSYRAAVAAGLRWVEVDARLTADDVLVASHDPVLPDGRFISELPAADTGLMRVDELLDELPAEVGVDVDVKSSVEDALRPRERTTGALVAGLVRRERRPLLLTSFDPAALLVMRELAPGVPLGLLTWIRFPLRKAIAAAAHLGFDAVAPHVGSFRLGPRGDRALLEHDGAHAVRVAHEAGLQVIAWCPLPDERDAFLEAGVDGLVVDDAPAAVRETRAG